MVFLYTISGFIFIKMLFSTTRKKLSSRVCFTIYYTFIFGLRIHCFCYCNIDRQQTKYLQINLMRVHKLSVVPYKMSAYFTSKLFILLISFIFKSLKYKNRRDRWCNNITSHRMYKRCGVYIVENVYYVHFVKLFGGIVL